MDEFELIRRYFDRDTPMDGVVTGIGDDGAVLLPDATRQQVQVIDTLVAGVHFPPTTNPADIAYPGCRGELVRYCGDGGYPPLDDPGIDAEYRG